jgi:hypothetical protein
VLSLEALEDISTPTDLLTSTSALPLAKAR